MHYCTIYTTLLSVADPGRHPGRGPPSALSKNNFQVKEIISYGYASSARLLIIIYLSWGISAMANGQWPTRGVSTKLTPWTYLDGIDRSFCYACALDNQSFNTNFTRHASLYTVQWTLSRTHVCQYDITLYYSMCCTVLWRHTLVA